MNRTSAFLLAAVLLAGCEPSTSGTGPQAPTSTANDDATAVTATATTTAPNAAPTGSPTTGKALTAAQASNAFAYDLLGKLRANQGNLAYSPASISVALTMTYGGAKGETAAQMAKVLHLGAEPVAMHGSWQKVLRRWQTEDKPKPYELSVANRLFGQKAFTFEPGFLSLTKESYAAPLELRDFVANPDGERRHINSWVEQRTNKRITNLIPKAGITTATRLVLTNAIYFKAQWVTPFSEYATAAGDFFAAKGKVSAQMMNKSMRARHAQTDGVQLLELPYKGGDFSMLLALPDDKNGIAKLEEAVIAGKLTGWLERLAPTRVAVSMPRFKIEPATSLAMKPILSAMGMPLAFDRSKADFTGMANPASADDRLSISNVFHKAFVEVNEKGTEAAAATAVVMGRKGAAAPTAKPIVFRADHPFMFFIRENDNGHITFVGRVADPS